MMIMMIMIIMIVVIVIIGGGVGLARVIDTGGGLWMRLSGV